MNDKYLRWLAFVLTFTALMLAHAALPAAQSGWSEDLRRDSAAPAAQQTLRPQLAAILAKKVERAAAARRARVFLVARVGRPPESLPPGIRYTHAGLAMYGKFRRSDGGVGRGYVMYNLYQSAEDPQRSRLAQDFLADFFVSAEVMEAGIAIPTPALQARLHRFIGSPGYKALHNPRYSAISNPFDTRYQNCNEFILDVLHAAIYELDSVERIKAHSSAYFEPHTLSVNPVRLLLGALFTPDIRTTDHANGEIRIATYGALVAHLLRHGLLQETLTILPPTNRPSPSRVQ